MIEFYYQITEYTSYFAVVIAILCLIYYRQLDYAFQIFALYLIVSGSFDIVSNELADKGQNNLMYLHLFTLIELILLGSFFMSISRRISSNYVWKGTFTLLIFGVVCNSLWIQSLGKFNSYSATACSMFVVCTCVYYFIQSLSQQVTDKERSIKWIVVGLFIYHSAAMVIMIFSNLLLQLESDGKAAIWITRAFIIVLTKLLFISALTYQYMVGRKYRAMENSSNYA